MSSDTLVELDKEIIGIRDKYYSLTQSQGLYAIFDMLRDSVKIMLEKHKLREIYGYLI